MPIYIYALIDPFTDEIRYIGKTIRPTARLVDHCKDHSHCHRTHWIQQVIAMGKRPALRILQELPDDVEWQPVEQSWIAYGRSVGWQLTNSTDGGDGVVNLSGESKERMLKTWKGRKHRPDSLVKIGAASRGRIKSEASKQIMREKMKGRAITWIDKVRQGVQKLTDDQVRTIRSRIQSGETHRSIARDYGVNPGTISNIRRGKSYSHVI